MHNIEIFVTCFLVLYFVGYVPYAFIRPTWLPKSSSIFFLPPYLGLLLISVASAYAIKFASSMKPLTFFAIAFALLGFLLAAIEIIRSIKSHRITPTALRRAFATGCAGILIVIFVLFFGINRQGQLSTVYVNGVDVAGYSVTGEYLRTWSGYSALEKSLIDALAQPDPERARSEVDTAVNAQLIISSEFILRAYRWSYPAILATIANIVKVDSVYRLNYVLLACILAALASTATIFTELLGASFTLALIAGAAAAINCNILNITLQGQYAQLAATPALILFILQVWLWRKDLKANTAKQNLREFLLILFIVAGLMPLYNEMIFTICVFFGLVACVDLFTDQRRYLIPLAMRLAPLMILGLIFEWPVTGHWLTFLTRHLAHIRVGGWPQPTWANPAEILGLANIYQKFAPYEMTPGYLGFLFSLFLSCLIVPASLTILKRMGPETSAIFIAPIFFIMTVFLKTRFWERIHSYQYMKAYTFFAPLLTIGFFAGLWTFASRTQTSIARRRLVRSIAILLFLDIVITSAQYSARVLPETIPISENLISMKSRKDFFREHLVWSEPGDLTSFFLAALVPYKWLNMSATRVLGPHTSDRVAVIHFHNGGPESNSAPAEWRKVYSDQDTTIFETQFTGRDFADAKGVMRTIEPTAKLQDFLLQLAKLR